MRIKTALPFLLCGVILFHSCKKEDPPLPAFTFRKATGFVISDKGEKLLATDAGLCSLDVNMGIFVAVENGLGTESLNDLVYSFHHPEKELWLASNQGAYNYTVNYHITEANSGLENNQVSCIDFNQKNIPFFASSRGISIYLAAQWETYMGLDMLFLHHDITDMGSATNGYTYVCTFGGGIERFKAGVDGISGATIMDTDWTQLESNYVNSVYIDDTTQVYGTNAGVAFHFSEYTKWDWEVYTTADGLVNDNVFSVVRDLSGSWWIGTDEGISLFDGSSWISYTSEDFGLTSNYVPFLALDLDGSIWMASNKGMSHFSKGNWTAYPKASQ